MLLVHDFPGGRAKLPQSAEIEFARALEVFQGELRQAGVLLEARRLTNDGRLVTGSKGVWVDRAIDRTYRAQVAHYLIRAPSIRDAVVIASRSPEFRFHPSAQIEVRLVSRSD